VTRIHREHSAIYRLASGDFDRARPDRGSAGILFRKTTLGGGSFDDARSNIGRNNEYDGSPRDAAATNAIG
jgi:hypothetical protein